MVSTWLLVRANERSPLHDGLIFDCLEASASKFSTVAPALIQYYNRRKTYFAHDAQQQCTVGDVVLLKALVEPRSKHVKHELAQVVHKVGRGVDPLTGKRVAGAHFLEPLDQLHAEDETLARKVQSLNITADASISRYDGLNELP